MLMGSLDKQIMNTVISVLFVFVFVEKVFADPSFDCERASTADEYAICRDPTLAHLDTLVAQAYRNYQPTFQSRGTVGRALLGSRQGCGADTSCILAAQYQSLYNYGFVPRWVENSYLAALSAQAYSLVRSQASFSNNLPVRAGDCRRTRVSSVTTRWGGPVNYENGHEGTVVEYDSGLALVSYDRPASISSVRIGEGVTTCLMSIPFDCPRGDQRGRIYYSVNDANSIEWIMADAQHMCGGA